MRFLVPAIATSLLVGSLVAAPALARDGHAYAQIGAGVVFQRSPTLSLDGQPNAAKVNFHSGDYDVELVGGYDFGKIRVEGELAYKRSRVHVYGVNVPTILDVNKQPALGLYPHITGRIHNRSAMVNVLGDLGGNKGPGLFAGAGIGLADIQLLRFLYGRNRFLRDGDIRPATQLIGGAYVPLTKHLQVGIKGRYMMIDNAKHNGLINNQHYKGDYRMISALGTLGWNF